jgi:hypothetical protein
MATSEYSREERLARNEAVLRSVNERIEQGAERFQIEGEAGFLCECSSIECRERLPLSVVEYERVRAYGARFALAPGHADLSIERIVEHHEGYDIVEKTGAGKDVAEKLDPRRDDG